MVKIILTQFILTISSLSTFCQKVAVAPERNNVLYIEVDNPLTIVVENQSCKHLVVKTDNGDIDGENGKYNCKPKSIGSANIIVFVNQAGKLKEIKRIPFRVKYLIPVDDIQFYIANCGKDCKMTKSLLTQQKFVRAQVMNTEINATYPVDRFDVEINVDDSIKKFHNVGNEISQELQKEFSNLAPNSILSFTNIYSHRPDGNVIPLSSVKLTVTQ